MDVALAVKPENLSWLLTGRRFGEEFEANHPQRVSRGDFCCRPSVELSPQSLAYSFIRVAYFNVLIEHNSETFEEIRDLHIS